MTADQIERYRRQIILPEIGEAGQERLLSAKVGLVGAGGLGSAAGYYLAAAGVGAIAVIDGDRVELSNLQRQIAHSTRRIGRLKAESAKTTWEALNPDARVIAHAVRLTAANSREILGDCDLVVDASDNFPTRYLVNDACVRLQKPLISAAVFQFEGRVISIHPGQSACYRCLFPTPPPAGSSPPSDEIGVLGMVPGVLGALQATEVVKILLGIGAPLRGRLLIWNALEMSFVSVQVPRNPECPVCGDHPQLTALVDGEPPCGAD